MLKPVVCRLVDPRSDEVAELACLFELYRLHYGQSPSPEATHAWIGEVAGSGELVFCGAFHGSRMVGFAAVHRVPASLALRQFWQLRDLFVDPGLRRQGIAQRLVETVRRAATEAGALRLSLQTEPDNAAALALYRGCDFTVNEDLLTLSLNLLDSDRLRTPEKIRHGC